MVKPITLFLPDMLDWARGLQDRINVSSLDERNEAAEVIAIKTGLDDFIIELEQTIKYRKVLPRETAISIETIAKNLYHEWQALARLENPKINDEIELVREVPIGRHTLPPLPYDYGELEPFISRRIMLLHHSQHHQSYVDGLNKAEREMEKARQTKQFDLLKHWEEREAAFHGAGHYLHTIFWETMNPRGGGNPSGNLLAEIDRSFGGFDMFKNHFSEAAKRVEGSGWSILVWSPRPQRLEILQAEKHQNLSQWDIIPLLPLDVWEHAYYLQYENNRSKYVENWWNVVYWPEVERRYKEAEKVRWQQF